MPLNFNSVQLGTHTLTDILNELGTTAPQHNDKSLRLHSMGEGPDRTHQLKVHTSKSNIITSLKSLIFGLDDASVKLRHDKRVGAFDMVKSAIMNEFDMSEETATQLMSRICKKNDSVTIGELRQLKQSGLEETVERLKTQWDDKFSLQGRSPVDFTHKHQSLERFATLELRDFFDSESWKHSDKGANGAIIIRNPELPGGGAILKFEGHMNMKAGQQISNYMAQVFQNFFESEMEFPLEGMITKPIDLPKEAFDQLHDKISELNNESSVTLNLKHLDDSQEEHETPLDQVHLTASMFVDNSTPLDQLPALEKVALCKGDKMPQQFGQAMILGRMFGLGDHIGITTETQPGVTNMSNFMINNDTGKLAFIDYACAFSGRLSGELPLNGFLAGKLTPAFQALSEYSLENFSPEKIEQHMEDIAMVMSSARKDQVINALPQSMEVLGPLTSIMDMLHSCSNDSTLFTDQEVSELGMVTPQEKAKFAANVLLGAIDAIKLIAENSEKFIGPDGLELPFEGAEEVFDTIKSLNSEALQTVRNSIAEYLSTH